MNEWEPCRTLYMAQIVRGLDSFVSSFANLSFILVDQGLQSSLIKFFTSEIRVREMQQLICSCFCET